MQVEVTSLTGKKRTHPIRSLRKCSDKEMLAIYSEIGDSLTERMQNFYPIVVHSTSAEKEVIEILWIDHSAATKDNYLLQAVING